jgi:hypothetical protein
LFKDIRNGLTKKGNQVHTRALHGEENAFLQIVKYGGQAINGGYLFTTSSPCELCAKKAYQLGIIKIFFIDPYPGISKKHILLSGNNTPELQLFQGAIGRAYHQLYEPIMSYKDELKLMGIEPKNTDIVSSAFIDALNTTEIGEPVKDAYNTLKAALKKKLDKKSDIVRVMELLEKKPESKLRQKLLQEEIATKQAHEDEELNKLAKALQEKLNENSKKQVVTS